MSARPSKSAPIACSGAMNAGDRKSTRLNSSHVAISYAVFCLKKKKNEDDPKYVACMMSFGSATLSAPHPASFVYSRLCFLTNVISYNVKLCYDNISLLYNCYV